MIATCSAPRRDRTKASVRTPSATRSASRSAVSEDAARRRGAPFSPVNWRERRLPQRQRHLAARRAVAGHGEHVETGEPAGRGLGLGDGGRGEDERRPRAVGRADPAQPPEHLGDVGAEDPAVVVALVDHDVARAGRGTARQRSWPGSSERCSMSGLVSTYSAWSRAHSRWSRLLSPSWVVTRTSRPSADEPGELVLGQRLGRREVEGRWRRAGRAAREWPAPRSAPAAGRRATCPRRCRWRGRRAVRRTPRRLPRPGAARARPPRGRGRPRAPPGRPSPARARCGPAARAAARGGSAGPRGRGRRPTGPSPRPCCAASRRWSRSEHDKGRRRRRRRAHPSG